jgi:hypothetical protein
MNQQPINSAFDERVSPDVAPAAGQNGSPSPNRGSEVEIEEQLNYEPVPPRTAVTVSVRYCVRGRGRPLLYPLDEGTDE